VPASLETVNIPNIAYRPLADFPVSSDLVLVSRRNEPSPAVRRFIEIARLRRCCASVLGLAAGSAPAEPPPTIMRPRSDTARPP
jgi:hypothetical protein